MTHRREAVDYHAIQRVIPKNCVKVAQKYIPEHVHLIELKLNNVALPAAIDLPAPVSTANSWPSVSILSSVSLSILRLLI